MTELRTERLLLRPARPGDLAAMHAILSNERAMAYWSTLPHREISETREWLDLMMATEPSEGADFIVEHDGAVTGKAGFYRFPHIGYLFHPDHWGRGLASEALRELLRHAFADLGMAVIHADVDPRNMASCRLLTGLGFRDDGRAERTWLIGDQWCDSVYFRLDAEDWARENLNSAQI